MPQHYSDARAVVQRRGPESRSIPVLYLVDTPTRANTIEGLRSAGPASEIRYYHSIPDGNGDYVRDHTGNAVVGKRIRCAVGKEV